MSTPIVRDDIFFFFDFFLNFDLVHSMQITKKGWRGGENKPNKIIECDMFT